MGICINDGKNEVTLGVMKFPDRKRSCLYLMIGNGVEPLAYFTTPGKAKRYEEFIENLCKVVGVKDKGCPEKGKVVT